MKLLAPIRNRVSSMGIQTKLAAAVGICATVALSLGFNLQLSDKEQTLETGIVKNGGLISELVASQLGAPTKFMDGTRISSIYGPVVNDDLGIIAVDVLHASEGRLSQFDRGEERAASVSALMEEAVQLLEAGEQDVSLVNASAVVAATPITSTSSSTPVGYLVITWDLTESHNAAFQEALNSLLVSSLAALGALGLIVFLTGRLVTRPVIGLGHTLDSIAAHDYGVAIPSTNRSDEIGKIANCLQNVRDRLADDAEARRIRTEEDKERLRLFDRLGEGLAEIADGRVDRPIDLNEFGSLGENSRRICEDFNDVLAKLKQVLTTATRAAESVKSSAQEISESVVDQSKRSEAQAVTLEESAAAIETLSISVEQTAENAADASERILQNRQQAQSGGEVVGQTVQAMRNIEESSDQITAIIGVIDDIAFQTNLLALNAGVEAARAGEAGRGFAVVASEVRALAQRASDSANEIKDLIHRSGEQVTKGSELVNKAGNALEEIITGVNFASDLVSKIAAGSRDQADNLREIKDSVTDLDRVTQRNAAMIEESSAASRNLSDEAVRMADVLQVFKLSTEDVSISSAAHTSENKTSEAPQVKQDLTEAVEKTKTSFSEVQEKASEWDEDAKRDAQTVQKTKPQKEVKVAKQVRTKPTNPHSAASSNARDQEPVMKFKSNAAGKKQTAVAVSNTLSQEDWEDF